MWLLLTEYFLGYQIRKYQVDKKCGPYGEEREGHRLENGGLGCNNHGGGGNDYEMMRVL
jgi:hypothetical protein